MIQPYMLTDQSGGAGTAGTTTVVDATPIMTASNNPLLVTDPSAAYGILPPTTTVAPISIGTSAIAPNPIDTVPVTTNVPTTTTTGTSTIVPSPIDTVPIKTEPTGSVTVSGVPLLGTSPSGILASLGNMFGGGGGGGSAQNQNTKEKENPTYWIYVVGASLVLGYLLISDKKSK